MTKFIDSLKVKKKLKYNFYPVRASNSKADLVRWGTWAKKESPKQKLIFIDTIKEKFQDPKFISYWKHRMKAGYEQRYMVYGSY